MVDFSKGWHKYIQRRKGPGASLGYLKTLHCNVKIIYERKFIKQSNKRRDNDVTPLSLKYLQREYLKIRGIYVKLLKDVEKQLNNVNEEGIKKCCHFP